MACKIKVRFKDSYFVHTGDKPFYINGKRVYVNGLPSILHDGYHVKENGIARLEKISLDKYLVRTAMNKKAFWVNKNLVEILGVI